MKSDNKSLSNEISAAILGKLHGLNAKSARRLVKAVDDCSKDIVKKFAKLQKDEANEQEKDAKKAVKKALEKAKEVAKAKEKATEKATLQAKIAIVTEDGSIVSEPKTEAPKKAVTAAPTVAKTVIA